MKEEKVGKKPKGMVVVISVGKPGGKKPEREADPDTKKKAQTRDNDDAKARFLYDRLPDEAFGITPQVENPATGYNRRMMVDDLHTDIAGGLEPGIPFEEPHMELRLDPEERELNRLQGVQGDSPNIRPRLHSLHGSKHSPLQDVTNPNYLAQPFLIPQHEWVDAPLSLEMLLNSPAEGADEDKIRYQDGERQEYRQVGRMRNPNVDYRKRIPQPMKTAVQQRRGEGIIQRSEDDDILSDILKGDLSDVEFCDCCSPAEISFEFLKAKKKSKPFHGYNPKRHHKKGGLNQAGRDKFKRETGANLKPPVTTKPSKLKPGSKKAKRRKSFCARMSGSKGPTSKKGKLTPKGAALKRWNC